MEELYPYYERELAFIQESGAEFAARYPDAARELGLDRFEPADPHVERLIQGFSLLAARVHYRLDADYPEFRQSLLELLYPHLLRPMPSTAIVQLAPARGREGEVVAIPRGYGMTVKRMLRDRAEDEASGDECYFRTCYPVTLRPLVIEQVEYASPSWAATRGCRSGLSIRLRCEGGFETLGTGTADAVVPLRFCLRGSGHVPFTLYELLQSDCTSLLLRDPSPAGRVVELPADAIRPVGFEPDESLLPVDRRVFDGFRQLQEYFACPDKFLFVDVDCVGACARAGFHDVAELFFELTDRGEAFERQRPLRGALGRDNVLLHCTPVINLFERHLHIRVDHRVSEQPIAVDPRRPLHGEIFSVNTVSSVDPLTGRRVDYPPLTAHLTGDRSADMLWRSSRRASSHPGDSGTEVFLSFVDPASKPVLLHGEGLRVSATCTNRDLPAALSEPGGAKDPEPITEGVIARFVRRPSLPARRKQDEALEWQLLSHLVASYTALMPGDLTTASAADGAASLRSMLAIYLLDDDPAMRRQLEGIVGVTCAPSTARVVRPNGHAGPPIVLAGYAIDVSVVDDGFRTNGHFVLASVLERFFGLAAAVNSFVQFTVRSDAARRFQWKPRAGTQRLR